MLALAGAVMEVNFKLNSFFINAHFQQILPILILCTSLLLTGLGYHGELTKK